MLLWDADTGQLKTTLTGHARGRGVSSIAFSPNGDILASVSLDEVLLWDARTGLRKAALSGEKEVISSLASGRVAASSPAEAPKGQYFYGIPRQARPSVHFTGYIGSAVGPSGFVLMDALSPARVLKALCCCGMYPTSCRSCTQLFPRLHSMILGAMQATAPVAKLPQSVQSGDMATVSIGKTGGSDGAYPCGNRRAYPHALPRLSTGGAVSAAASCGLFGMGKTKWASGSEWRVFLYAHRRRVHRHAENAH